MQSRSARRPMRAPTGRWAGGHSSALTLPIPEGRRGAGAEAPSTSGKMAGDGDDGPARTFGNITLAGQGGGSGALSITKAGFGWKAREHSRQSSVASTDVLSLQWVRGGRGQQIRVRLRGGASVRFEGFRESDHGPLNDFFSEAFGKQLVRGSQAVRGWSWGQVDFMAGGAPSLVFNAGGGSSTRNKANELEEAFEVPIGAVANVQLPGKNELSLDLHVDDTAGKMDEELVEIRFYIPDEEDADVLLNKIKVRADTSAFAGESICSFNEVGIAVPRGRYEVDLFPNHIKLHGKSHDFKILYSSITRLFILPKPDDVLVSFVMSLDPPIRQGSTMYPHIVFNFQADEQVDVDLAIEADELAKKYNGKLKSRESGEIWRVFSRVMKNLSQSPLFLPKTFRTTKDAYAVRTALGANEGFLFFLESSAFFVNKPPTYIRYENIDTAEFKRMELERRFDLSLSMASGPSFLFSNIDRTEFQLIFKFLETKKVPIENADVLRRTGGRAGQVVMMDEEGGSSESDDEDFDMEAAKEADKTGDAAAGKAASDGDASSSDGEDDEDGEDVEFDADLDEVKDLVADGEDVGEPTRKRRRKSRASTGPAAVAGSPAQ
jgi:structure-specific recognition protein 1